jgi:hypothetical protein
MTDANNNAGKPSNQGPYDAALGYAATQGWKVFPAVRGEKKSHKAAHFSNGARWGATNNAEEIRLDFSRWPNANVGIPCGGENKFFVVEADTLQGHNIDGVAGLKELEARHSPLPATRTARSPSGSLHYYFRHPGNGTKIKNSTSAIAKGVDVRGDGGMVVAPPSRRDDGEYVWLNDLPIADAPPWLIELVKDRKPENKPKENTPEAPLHRLIAAAAVMPNDDLPWDEWNARGMAFYSATAGSDEGLAIFSAFSSKSSSKYDEDKTAAKWREYHSCPPTEITAGSVFHWANESCPRPQSGGLFLMR